jgi:EmrB/QacA subfamily drug resistance transporter
MTPEIGRQHYNLTLGVLVLSALAYALSQTMVAPALPEMQAELGTSTTTVTFVLTAYLLTASVATPIVGRLGDMFGKERLLLITLVCFAAGSLICGLSHSIGLLIAGRAVQGVGGAVFPLAFGIIRDEFPPEKVATGIGLISATFGIGGGAGLVLSGVIVDHLPYEWIFWLALVFVAVAIVATHLFVPESPIKSPAKVDLVGAALLAVGLTAVLIGVSEGPDWGWGDDRVIGLFGLGAVALAVWTAWERRAAQPLVDMKMMAQRGVLTTNLTALLVGFGMFGSFILIPRFVQVDPAVSDFGFGASVTEAGVFLLPSALVMLFAGPTSGWLGTRHGSKLPLLLGTAICAVSFTFLAAAHSERWEIYAGTTLMGVGIGLAFAAMANLIVEAVDRTKTSVSTAMNTIMRTIGGSLGGQITASVVAAHTIGASGAPAEAGFTIAFVISAIGVGAAFCAALAIPARLPFAARPGPAAPQPSLAADVQG